MDYLGINIPFLAHLGAVLEYHNVGYARLSLELLPEHTNSVGVAQGGLVMTLLDVAMALAARSTTEPMVGMATISQTTNFLRPSTGKLIAEGTVLKSGKSVYYCQAVLTDQTGLITAQSTGAFSPRV